MHGITGDAVDRKMLLCLPQDCVQQLLPQVYLPAVAVIKRGIVLHVSGFSGSYKRMRVGIQNHALEMSTVLRTRPCLSSSEESDDRRTYSTHHDSRCRRQPSGSYSILQLQSSRMVAFSNFPVFGRRLERIMGLRYQNFRKHDHACISNKER